MPPATPKPLTLLNRLRRRPHLLLPRRDPPPPSSRILLPLLEPLPPAAPRLWLRLRSRQEKIHPRRWLPPRPHWRRPLSGRKMIPHRDFRRLTKYSTPRLWSTRAILYRAHSILHPPMPG